MTDPELIDILRRFVKKVAIESTDDELGDEADELILLYGDPDAEKPRGIINANSHIHHWTVVLEDATDQNGPLEVAVCGCGTTRTNERAIGRIEIHETKKSQDPPPRSLPEDSDR